MKMTYKIEVDCVHCANKMELAAGFANMWIAIFADIGVMLIAVVNSLRAFKIS